MKVSSWTVLALSSVIGLTTLSKAGEQEQRQREVKAAVRPARGHFRALAEKLDLTGEQKEKLKGVVQDQHSTIKALRAEATLSRRDRRMKLQELREASREKLKVILTKEQLEKWEQIRPPEKKR